MKKVFAFLLAVMLIASLTVPVYAATFKVPDVPQISNIKFNVKIELPEDFWTNWFKEHPLNLDLSGVIQNTKLGS